MLKHKIFSPHIKLFALSLVLTFGVVVFLPSPEASAAVTKSQVDQTIKAKCDALKTQTNVNVPAKTTANIVCSRPVAKTASASASNLLALCRTLDKYEQQKPDNLTGSNLFLRVGTVDGGDCRKTLLPSSETTALANSGNTGGEGASPTSVCDLKIKKAECLKDIEDCREPACFTAKASKFPDVYAVCRDRPNPQSCHNRVKTACEGKTGEELKTCRQEFAVAPDDTTLLQAKTVKNDRCGGGTNKSGGTYASFETQFNFGCTGQGNAIVDLSFAIVRFLSIGVGLVLAAAIIYAGILYSTSSGNPEATSAAKQRIQNAVIALVFYLFIFAIIQYLVPGGLFN